MSLLLALLVLVPIYSCSLQKETTNNSEKKKEKSSQQNKLEAKPKSKLVNFDFDELNSEEKKILKEKFTLYKNFWVKALIDKETLHDFYVFDPSLSYKESQNLISYAKSKSQNDRYGHLVNFKIYFDLEEFDLARSEVLNLLNHTAATPEDKALAHLLIGDTYLRCQKYNLLEKELDLANGIKSFSNSTKFLRHQLNWYQKRSLGQATKLTDESCPHSLRFSGLITRTSKKPWVALKFYKKAESLAPDDPRTYIGKSACFLQAKKRLKALEELNKTNSSSMPKLLNLEHKADLYGDLSRSKLATIDYIKHFINVSSKKCITLRLNSKSKKIQNTNFLLSSINRWVNENKNDSRGLHVKACILHSMNKPKLSLKAHNQAISMSPNEATYYVARAKTWLASINSAEAINDLNYAIDKLNYQATIPLRMRGQAFMDLGEYEKAAIDFSICLNIDTNDGIIYYDRGLAYMQQKKPKKAEFDLLKSIELSHKTSIPTCRNLAYLYDSAGDLPKALKYYNICLKKATGNSTWKMFQRRGNLHVKLENWQKAVDDYSKVLKINKVASGAYLKRGKAYEKLGKLELAKNDLDKAKSMDDYLFGQ